MEHLTSFGLRRAGGRLLLASLRLSVGGGQLHRRGQPAICGDPGLAHLICELVFQPRLECPQERLPHDYVEQILLRMRRAGLVDSVRGAKGGYLLAREPQAVSVKDVIEASEHVTFEVNCDLHRVDDERCDPSTACSIRPVWRLLERRINDLLAGITLADLMHAEPEVYQIAGAAAGS